MAKPTTITPAAYRETMSEADLQATILAEAKQWGWLRVHFRPAKTEKGWVTPYTGDDGFPDTVLCRNRVVLFWEIKNASRKATGAQEAWLAALPNARIIRPADLDWCREVLR